MTEPAPTIPALWAPETVASRSPDLLMAEVGGEAVLMSVENGSYYGLADTARAIWLRLEQPTTIADLCAALCCAYEGEPEQITAETRDFLALMAEKGLIHIA